MTWRLKRSTGLSVMGIRCVCAKHLPELAELEVRQLPPCAPSSLPVLPRLLTQWGPVQGGVIP